MRACGRQHLIVITRWQKLQSTESHTKRTHSVIRDEPWLIFDKARRPLLEALYRTIQWVGKDLGPANNARRVARVCCRGHALALDTNTTTRRVRHGPRPSTFLAPRRGDTPLGQAQQQALRNARQFAQRVAEHIAMVANVDDANHERGMCSRVLQHSPAVPSMQQGCLLNAARSDCSSRCCKGNACIRHACMQRIAPPRCQRVQHR